MDLTKSRDNTELFQLEDTKDISLFAADFVRYTLRAALKPNRENPCDNATDSLLKMLKAINHSKGVDAHAVVEEVVSSLTAEFNIDNPDRLWISAAETGANYWLEITTSDNAARGRAAKRFNEFRDSVSLAQALDEKRRARQDRI